MALSLGVLEVCCWLQAELSALLIMVAEATDWLLLLLGSYIF